VSTEDRILLEDMQTSLISVILVSAFGDLHLQGHD
jgi:hypothetical protein